MGKQLTVAPAVAAVSTGCLGLALLRGLSLIASGSSTADASCQTSATAQLEGISRKLLMLEDGYLEKVGVGAGQC